MTRSAGGRAAQSSAAQPSAAQPSGAQPNAASGAIAVKTLALTVASRHGDASVVVEQDTERAVTGQVVLAGHAPRPAFLLALTHGAGGGVDAPDLLAVRDVAVALGGAVARVAQPYLLRGARAPGSAVRQDEAWVDVIAALREQCGGPGIPFLQGGRSNGARLACRTARYVGADAVIALAFPLHPPGRPERSRRSELLAAGVPVLAVSGGSDPFGIPDSADVAHLVVLAGQGHTLAKRPAAVGTAVSHWLGQWLSRSAYAADD